MQSSSGAVPFGTRVKIFLPTALAALAALAFLSAKRVIVLGALIYGIAYLVLYVLFGGWRL